MDFEEPVDLNYNVELESQHFQESDQMSTPADNEFSEATSLILNSIDHVNLNDGNVITEYHPSAILDPWIVPLKEYLASSTRKPDSVFDSCPWYSFSSQLDFDLAEFILHMGMNHQAQSDFFSIIDRCRGNQSTEYTIRNENDLAEVWSWAENRFTKFKKETISVPYKDELRNYDVHYRPLWDWTLDLLNDKDLAPHFVWDAVQLFREDKNGIRTQFFDEPWTGNTFWEIQFSSSWGKAFGIYFGYPVMAHCGNLPDEIRNRKNFGGGCVVGWLPIVEEEDNRGKPSWINFNGYAFKLPNSEKVIILYPFILILSADYEEHCMMTLTRGVRAHYPCPVCLVPLSNLSDLSINYPLRTTESMKEIYERACLLSAEKAEDLLKLHGLHKVPADKLDKLKSLLMKYGKKYEHMSRQILFAAQAVLTKTADPAGSHLELDVYTAMDVHTENTIKAGQSIMQVFGERM
ncbi:hypothetical protein EV421DRAFT_1746878 [Armillaria borealis]|uniref:Uncharacterized protein n=1 Tax=Armillaria borealis TaxID=47425 RepID=A0AA39IDI3_9AGAR|nr:hypothetical protein EV421DRAFT_1746878 [Armillaria borealis]